jgi:hypothetical protein
MNELQNVASYYKTLTPEYILDIFQCTNKKTYFKRLKVKEIIAGTSEIPVHVVRQYINWSIQSLEILSIMEEYIAKVVDPTHRPRSTPQKHSFSAPGTHSC